MLAAAAVLVSLLVGGVLMFLHTSARPADAGIAIPSQTQFAEETSAAALIETVETSGSVEVPDFTGKSLDEANVVAAAAGLAVEPRQDASTAGDGSGAITMQDPPPGALVAPGAVIIVRTPAASRVERAMAPVTTDIVVCIDPGHQSRSDLTQEPIGPGASQTKDRVRGGTTGVSTRVPEYEAVLQISMNLKQRLEAAGITVVMTRMTNDVNISNAERAQIANEAGAALFVRVHADGSTDQNVVGISTLYAAGNSWTAPIAAESKRAAEIVHRTTTAFTGAVSRGTVARGDLTGFNWAKVPAIVVECGFMSNPVEDKLLTSPHYQDKLAEGMARGIIEYTGVR